MSSKNKTQVIIAGKIYTLSGYESEEYLQKVAAYLNGKITEFRGMDGYHRLSQEMRSILLNLNIADDYFKVRKKIEACGLSPAVRAEALSLQDFARLTRAFYGAD